MVLLALFLLHQGVLPVVAWFLPQLETWFYDFAVFGIYRTQEYVTYPLSGPQGAVLRQDERCDKGLVFIAPYGDSVEEEGPVILDSQGNLIWSSNEYGVATNFGMQQYRGENYLTFWAGDKNGGQGRGELYMLDSKYRVGHEVHAVGQGLGADLHEFEVSKDDTALLTVYNTTRGDLRGLGWWRSEDGWIEDSLFQEVDIATGELLFQWSAMEHFKPDLSYYWTPTGGYVRTIPYDFFHINSVEKDSKGNYLISARHFHTITYIHGTTGEIIWVLGGGERFNQFEDLSDGLATAFSWQHHARWFSEEEGIISIMDNGYAGPMQTSSTYSRAMLVQIDQVKLTATHLQSFGSLGHTKAASQGSVQRLPNGNVFVGWGSAAAYSEYLQDGTLLCESHFAASWSFSWERAKSFRTYTSHDWVGVPEYPPSAKIEGNRLFVSWNGATEVKFWQFEGLRNDLKDGLPINDAAFDSIAIVAKQGFEESMELPPGEQFTRFRVGALDGQNQLLRYSEHVQRSQSAGASRSGIVIGICASVASVIGVWYLLVVWKRRKPYARVFEWVPMKAFFGRDQYRYDMLEVER